MEDSQPPFAERGDMRVEPDFRGRLMLDKRSLIELRLT